MKTISIKKSEINKDWWVADAEGQVLGRFASKIAQILRGKHKPDFTHIWIWETLLLLLMLKKLLLQNKETEKTYFLILDIQEV